MVLIYSKNYVVRIAFVYCRNLVVACLEKRPSTVQCEIEYVKRKPRYAIACGSYSSDLRQKPKSSICDGLSACFSVLKI